MAEEVGKLLSAEAAGVVRYEPAGRGTVVSTWSRSGVLPVAVGAVMELEAGTAVGRVYGTGRPGRTTGFEGAEGSLAQRLNELGYRSSLAAPIHLEGRPWGALAVGDVRDEPLAEGAEQRLARFAELVAQALANAEAREQLAASRGRLIAASDAERRRFLGHWVLAAVARHSPRNHGGLCTECVPGMAGRRLGRATGQSLAAGHADIVITQRPLELRRQS